MLRRDDVRSLRRLRSTAEHHDQLSATQGEVHSPAGTEMLTHFDDTLADGLHVTQVAQRGLTEPRNQSSLCRLVAQTFQPSIELWQCLDDVHVAIVIV